MTSPRRLAVAPRVLAAMILAVAMLTGCSSLSVSHLESRPVIATAPTSITMKFWRFEFTGALSGDAYVIHGRATPITSSLPPWVDRLEELTLTAYLRDPAGNVLASAEKTFKAVPLGPDAVVPFAFTLAPADQAAGNYGISFGYKALYGSSSARNALGASVPPPAGSVFFAGEGAVLKE